MRFSCFPKTSLLALLLVMLVGCADGQRQTARSLPQNQGTSQTSSTTGQKTQRFETAPLSSATGQVISQAPLAPVMPAVQPLNGKAKAAILLPLSGSNAALGQAMLNAAQQAVFDASGTNFELQPRDTAGAGGADGAARTAIANGAQLIIGPLFSADVPVAVQVARPANVPVLALSTDTSFTSRGVYMMGLSPAAQAERVVAFAAERGVKRFAALVPATPYGQLVGQAFQRAVLRAGGSIVDYKTFDNAVVDGGRHAKDFAAKRDSFDALFLPLTGEDLKIVTDELAASGVNPAQTRILGTGLWDVAGLGKQHPLLVGAWFAAPDPAARRNFASAYTAAFGAQPPRLATLAYDATALAALLAKRGMRLEEAALTNPNGFAGLDGVFRLLPTGEVERMLAVNEVTSEGTAIVDLSPSSFVKP